MKQSELFTKTLKDSPKDEASVNAVLLTRGGFVSKIMAGVYAYLPLGFRVLNNIRQIIREEMDAIGGQELHMSVLQNKETWETTKRWETAADVMYQFKDASQKEVGLGWTHEEPLTEIARHYISSYKDLPRAVYQIQDKFRKEPRAKSGLLRGREFLMKDLYSFHASDDDLHNYYEQVADSYLKIYSRLGIDAKRTVASGGLFSKFSDEFQVFSEEGEDTIYHCEKCGYTANAEVATELKISTKCPKCEQGIEKRKSIEVGNIFKLGTRFSEAFNLNFTDETGKKKPVIMASYGIGLGRVMGTIVEVSHDDKGIIWPAAVAPFLVHLISIKKDADNVYDALLKAGIEVLYDDRDASPGEKFADSDLIGIPWRVVVSEKTIKEKKIEVKRRNEGKVEIVSLKELIAKIKN